jgi:hypothetical protein
MTDRANGSHKEHIWLVALYEIEANADELLDRLSAIGVDTSEATTLRVEIDEQQRAARFRQATSGSPLSLTVRSAITGVLTGAAFALVIGLALFVTDALNLPFAAELSDYALVSVAIGGVIGAFIGAILGSARQRSKAQAPLTKMRQLKSDGFLVAVKMPPPLAEQAEEIARGLGAKEILL